MSFRNQELKAALASRDPYRVANVLGDLPPISPQTKGTPKTHKESLHVDGTDWSNVLSSWLDACDAASKVSHECVRWLLFTLARLLLWLKCLVFLQGNAIKCYEAQASLHSALNHIFSSSLGNWLVPALHETCRNTRLTALAADAGQKDHAKLQGAVTLLQESFSKTLNDRTEYDPNAPLSQEGSKKAGVLYIVNQLFSMYFRLNTLRLCKNLVR
jgi:hypothetical protein